MIDAQASSGVDSGVQTANLEDSAQPVFYDAGRGPLRVGRYLIYEQLSRGAFGIVYAAFDPDLDRKVAIKLVREVAPEGGPGESGGSVLMEAQATAQISHPNVVAIHDVGQVDAETARLLTGEDGAELVFLVMEFLAGPTLRGWMRENKDDRERILDVFCEAAAGLEAAHAQQLVHLDFKPSNAMFSQTGRLRVLDFGLARIVSRRARTRRLDESEDHSSTGPTAGTPPYMAPEQHEGLDADGRADQYAFCVTLYEALMGERPFDAAEPEELLAQKKKGVDSQALGHLPRFLRETLWRGLSPEPSNRFASMSELLVALESGRGRGRQRKRAMAGAALGLGLLGLGTFIGTESEGAKVCAVEAAAMEVAWNEELIARGREAFERSNPDLGTSAWEATARGVESYLATWEEQHNRACRETVVEQRVSAELMSERVACLERGMHQLTGLTELFATADASIVRVAPHSVSSLRSPASCVRSLPERSADADLAEAEIKEQAKLETKLARARLLGDAGRIDEALSIVDSVLKHPESSKSNGLKARASLVEAKALFVAVKYQDAFDRALEALALAEHAGLDSTRIECQLLLARSASRIGHLGEALTLAQMVLSHVEANYPGTALEAEALSTMASVRLIRDEWDQTATVLEREIEILTRLHGEDHPALALAYNNLGNTSLMLQGDLKEIEAHYRRAGELWSKAYGEGFWRVGGTHNNLALVYIRQGKVAEAMEEYAKAEMILTAAYPEGHPFLANVIINRADRFESMGEFRRALEGTNRSLEMRERLGSTDPLFQASALGRIARMHARLDEVELGRGAMQEALRLAKEAHEGDPWRAAPTVAVELDFLVNSRDWMTLGARLAAFEKLLAGQEGEGAYAQLHRSFLRARARLLVEKGLFSEALADLDAATRSELDTDEGKRAEAWSQLERGEAWLGLGEYEKAKKGCEEAIAYIESSLTRTHVDLGRLHLCAARAAKHLGRAEAEAQHRSRAGDIAKGPDISPYWSERLSGAVEDTPSSSRP